MSIMNKTNKNAMVNADEKIINKVSQKFINFLNAQSLLSFQHI